MERSIRQPMTKNHSLTRVQGRKQTHTLETILEGFLAKALQCCQILRAVEDTLPSKGGTGNDAGGYKMGTVTSLESLSPTTASLSTTGSCSVSQVPVRAPPAPSTPPSTSHVPPSRGPPRGSTSNTQGTSMACTLPRYAQCCRGGRAHRAGDEGTRAGAGNDPPRHPAVSDPRAPREAGDCAPEPT